MKHQRPPSIADFEALAAAVWHEIPQVLRQSCDGVVIRVVDWPDDDTLDEMGLESAYDLLGLYRGVDLVRRSVYDVRQDVDMIFLYRRPLLEYWAETGSPLGELVRHVLVHEIGHHFGFSDADMERIENED